jgi:hypothetical protein
MPLVVVFPFGEVTVPPVVATLVVDQELGAVVVCSLAAVSGESLFVGESSVEHANARLAEARDEIHADQRVLICIVVILGGGCFTGLSCRPGYARQERCQAVCG